MSRTTRYDVVVVGGGHAGCEAAAAAARCGAQTLLLTQRVDTIGEMSCNPAIGGVGKGHLVREIDALDGLMARAADEAAIHYRLLNRSKGPAVRGPRIQADRRLYRAAMQRLLAETPNLDIRAETVTELCQGPDQAVSAVRTATAGIIPCGAVVLTTGTFLRGVIHMGDERVPAGRHGDVPATDLARSIERLGLRMGRLKTGTPPRLHRRGIAWDKIERQPSDDAAEPMSWMTPCTNQRLIECGLTYTTTETHQLVRGNVHRTALYSGQIHGVGPRYCPSLEDKVVRFADRDRHQVFLEPEGLDDDLVYPNGISTSLPLDVQRRMVASIPGLECATIARPGYAIEYDFVDPQNLAPGLEVRSLKRLFLAGQINGTTGYEEAAAQGLMAGLNAARRASGSVPDRVLSRAEAYIGVLLDDLVLHGVSEPYRMLTARAEHRLSLRADNAGLRLTATGIRWGCIGRERRQRHATFASAVDQAAKRARQESATPARLLSAGIAVRQDGQRRTVLDVLGLTGVSLAQASAVFPWLGELSPSVATQIEAEALYAPYLRRQEAERRIIEREEQLAVPDDTDFARVSGLSREMQDRLERARPASLGSAGRVPGVTPAAIAALAIHLRRSTGA